MAAGDNAGFPNGRRPADDVVDLSLRVAMGALCVLTGASDTLQVGCRPGDAPAGGLQRPKPFEHRPPAPPHDAKAGQSDDEGA